MVYFVSISVYLLILAGIGVWKSRQVKSEADFAVAGRKLSPWVMVCTMLAVWIGTGSIVGNAEKTYETGMAALILPIGTFIGMILLSLIASKARSIEASSVPEIIGRRFGQVARALAVVSLIMAYMIIVSYQFNAGGAVLEVITGDKEPVPLSVDSTVTRKQVRKGRLVFTPQETWQGETSVKLAELDAGAGGREIAFGIQVVASKKIIEVKKAFSAAKEALVEKQKRLTLEQDEGKAVGKALEEIEAKLLATKNLAIIKVDNFTRVRVDEALLTAQVYRITAIPEQGSLTLVEPILTAGTATIIAAIFIIAYTMLAGLMSLAYADVVTGVIITLSMLITFPVYWFQAGGWEGMTRAFAAMGDRPQHMQFWGVYSTVDIINFCLPVFLLVLGDANQYQRIFASKNAKGAKSAVTTMIFAALVVELLIIACAWIAGSMTPDPEDGKYILLYAARHYLWLPLGCLFMVTVVGIIISTADGFLLVPSTTFIKDVYLNYINPKASEKKVLFLSRLMVLLFGVTAYLVTLSFGEKTGFFKKALFAFTIYGASITPSLVAAIVWRGVTKAGAISSILSGMVVAILWGEWGFVKDWEAIPANIRQLDAVLPAMLISVICLFAVSRFTRGGRQENDAEAATPGNAGMESNHVS